MLREEGRSRTRSLNSRSSKQHRINFRTKTQIELIDVRERSVIYKTFFSDPDQINFFQNTNFGKRNSGFSYRENQKTVKFLKSSFLS